MAGPRSIKEKVHLPIYDSITIEPKKRLSNIQIESSFRFFIHTKGKSNLETNVGLLSEFGRFEGWGMRVVIASDGTENLKGKLIYNTVTSLVVGGKTAIELPTWFFVGDGGGCAPVVTRQLERSTPGGFRFAEPIVIDKQQNFRAEMAAPPRGVVQGAAAYPRSDACLGCLGWLLYLRDVTAARNVPQH